jgi:hypothetical protein
MCHGLDETERCTRCFAGACSSQEVIFVCRKAMPKLLTVANLDLESHLPGCWWLPAVMEGRMAWGAVRKVHCSS